MACIGQDAQREKTGAMEEAKYTAIQAQKGGAGNYFENSNDV